MREVQHVWGPWDQKLSIFGEAMDVAVRRCVRPGDECYSTETMDLPSLGQVEAMSRKDRRRWDAGTWKLW